MSDLIRREDAIKAIEELPNAYNGWSDAYDKAYIIGTLEEVPSADRRQEDVDAVAIFMREMHNLEQGYITISEFDERIEPLRHLCYDRPQGEWIDRSGGIEGAWNYCSVCGEQAIDLYDYCPNCGAKMKGADDE